MSDKPRLVYSTDRANVIKLARDSGMSDADILATLVGNVYGKDARKKIIREWAPLIGLSEDNALDLARKNSLI